MGLAYTHKSISFAGEIVWAKDNSGPQLKILHERWYRHNLRKFAVGDRVSLVITNHKRKRTENQNRYYWGVYLPLIAKETGEEDLERLHELFKKKFLTKEKVMVLGEEVDVGMSTTDLSSGGFCEYIFNIQQLTGVEAPPTENYDLKPLRPTLHAQG